MERERERGPRERERDRERETERERERREVGDREEQGSDNGGEDERLYAQNISNDLIKATILYITDVVI